MYDESGSKRDDVFHGQVLPPEGRSVAGKADYDPVEKQLKLAVQRAAKGLVIATGCYLGYKLWKVKAERS